MGERSIAGKWCLRTLGRGRGIVCALLLLMPFCAAQSQYFGRNKVL